MELSWEHFLPCVDINFPPIGVRAEHVTARSINVFKFAPCLTSY